MAMWTIEDTRAGLVRCAARAGVDLEGLRVERVTLDDTWGHLSGVVFLGATPELRARAAEWYVRWADKRMGSGSYDAQRAIRREGSARRVWVDRANGGRLVLMFPDQAERWGWKGEGEPCEAVADTYYPGAD